MADTKVPYAAFPKQGPAVLGQAEYDRQLAAWQAYQDSLKHHNHEYEQEQRDPESGGDGGSGDGEQGGDSLDTFTYVQKYRLDGQSRKRVFRQQGIKAEDAEAAKQQGRQAMKAELDESYGEDGWKPINGTERAAKPRGKPFKRGEDPRRNEDGINQHGDPSGGSEGSGSDGEQGEGQSGGGGDDDTPKMPSCSECGQVRGSTEGCCAPEEPGELPKPEIPEDGPEDSLQLLRVNAAPLINGEADDRIRLAADPAIKRIVQASLNDVDDWTRKVVAKAVADSEVRTFRAVNETLAKLPKGGDGKLGSAELKRLRDVAQAAAKAEVGKAVDIESIVALVAEQVSAPKRIVVETDGKQVEIDGTPHHRFEEALTAIRRGFNLMLVGPSGSGKGFLAQHLAEALGLRFGFLSCSEGMSEGMILGRGVPLHDRFMYLQSSFVDFYENGGVFLLDEIDAANPNVLLIINECLSSPHLAIPNRTEQPYAKRHPDFHVIVAANTWGTGPNMEYVGRNRLDAAFLNRFIGSVIELDYDPAVEGTIAKAYLGAKRADEVLRRFWGIRKKLNDLKIKRVWSTRGLEKMCVALADGDDMATVLDAHTRGWTEDEKRKAGVA